MRRFLIVMGLCSVVAVPCSLVAVPSRAQTQTETEDKRDAAAQEVRDLADGKVTYEEVSTDVRRAITAVTDARAADRTALLAAILAVLAIIFKLLLSGIKLVGGLAIWGERQGAVIRILTLCLGIGVYFFGSVVGGMPWWEAFFISLSGPGSMVVHEYTQLFRSKGR